MKTTFSQPTPWRWIILFVSVWVLGLAGVNFYTPVMPSMVHALHTTPTAVKLTISLFLLGKGISMLCYSPIIELLRRKHFLLLGIGLFAVGSLLAFCAPSIDYVLWGRLIQGIGVSLCILMGRAVVNDLFKTEHAASVFSKIFAGNGLMIIVLPTLGALVATYFEWRIIFLIFTLYAMVIFVLIAWRMPSTRPYRTVMDLTALSRAYLCILGHPQFWGYVLCLALMTAGEKAFTTSAALIYINHVGLSKLAYGYLSSGVWLAHFLGLITCAVLLRRFSLQRTLSMGIGLTAISALVLLITGVTHTTTPTLLWLMVWIFMFGSGFILSTAAVGIVRPFPNWIALSTALAMGIEFLLAFCSSALVSHFSSKTVLPVSDIMGGCGALLFIAWYGLLRRTVC